MGRYPSHAARPRPELSQHFFRDPAFVRRLVGRLPIRTRTVLEIGSGTGAITEVLADCGFRVIAVEKDVRLFRALRSRLIGRTNIEHHHADVLEFRLPDCDYSVVSNIPFGVTAAVVRRLLSAPRPPRDAFLVVQLEAAQKFAGLPYETLFSLLHKPSFEFRIVRSFRRIDFDPPPRVRAALLRIHRRDQPLLSKSARPGYERMVRDVFGMERVARVALRRRFTRTQVRRLARDHAFSPNANINTLTFPQWLAIFRFYENVCLGRDPTAAAFPHLPAFNRLPSAPFASLR